MLIRAAVSIAVLSLALPAAAQTPAPQKIRSVTLTSPEQRCPESTADEVVVCARIAPGEQYRIPKELRNEGPVEVQRQSWAARQETMDEVGREAGGVPNSCSPNGTAGQTGCFSRMLERARADQRAGATTPPR